MKNNSINNFSYLSNNLEEMIEQLKAIINFSGDGLFVTDGNGNVLLVNKTFEELTGHHSCDLLGENVRELVNKNFYSPSISMMVLESKRTVSDVSYVPKVDKMLMGTAIPVFNDKGGIQLIVNSVRDITSLKKLEQELINSKAYIEKCSESNLISDEPIFKSRQMTDILDYVKQVAKYPSSILIQGSTGVGKEIVADLIYRYSDRVKKPYIKINCAAIPEQLLESELFGYTSGAFTGASKKGKPGLIELADKGTILFDEIGDMPLGIQAKLLRVINNGELTKIGDNKTIKIDIRVISSTNKNIIDLVNEGRFREDLYYRLNVVQINIPDLKERAEDIAPLANYYINKYCKKFQLNKYFSKRTLDCFISYDWPGNVRELQNLIENLVISVNGNSIDINHLPRHMVESFHEEIKDNYNWNTQTPIMPNIKEEVSKKEKSIIVRALQKEGSIRKAAQSIGVSHSTLSRKIKKLKINLND